MARSRKHRSSRSYTRKHKSGSQQAMDEIKFSNTASAFDSNSQNRYKTGNAKAKEVIRMPHLNSKSAQIKRMSNSTWGITAPDKLGVRTNVVKDGNGWKLKVTRVNSVIRSFSRLLKGQREPVPGLNTTKTNFRNQITELNRLGSSTGKWYMVRAVVAHENVHVKEWKDNFKTDWTTQKNSIESLKLSATGKTKLPHNAHKALRALPAFDRAKLTSNTSGNYPVFWSIADPNLQTDAAEKAIVNPRIEWICKYAKWQKWNPSANAVCTSKKII